MKITGVVVMAAVTAAGASAGESANGQKRVVDVCVYGGNADGIYSARELASKIFAGIGVRIEWHSHASCPTSAPVIQISFSERTPGTQPPEALAYALPYEGTHIVVFSERVKQSAKNNAVPQLLAYVLVHEIAHIFQNINRHSTAGIMKARWESAEYFDMSRGRLRFTAEDIDLIYRGLDGRQAREAVGTLIASR
jgi:hypothetical protein